MRSRMHNSNDDDDDDSATADDDDDDSAQATGATMSNERENPSKQMIMAL